MAAYPSIVRQPSEAVETVGLLQTSFRMEMETVANYLANSVHLDGVGAEEIAPWPTMSPKSCATPRYLRGASNSCAAHQTAGRAHSRVY